MKRLLLTFAFMLIAINVYAAHPLITDDTGTQGRGKFEFEFNGEWGRETDGGTVDYGQLAAAIACGIAEKVDFAVGVPFVMETPEDGDTINGVPEVALELKWNFYEVGIANFALKPGVVFPTGNATIGYGNGKIGYYGYFITSLETGPFAIHLNAGYIRNENYFDDREDLWHFSAACVYYVIENLGILANAGIERNADHTCDEHPAFLIAGFIWSPLENFDIDMGYKIGLNDPEVDHTLMAGVTVRW